MLSEYKVCVWVSIYWNVNVYYLIDTFTGQPINHTNALSMYSVLCAYLYDYFPLYFLHRTIDPYKRVNEWRYMIRKVSLYFDSGVFTCVCSKVEVSCKCLLWFFFWFSINPVAWWQHYRGRVSSKTGHWNTWMLVVFSSVFLALGLFLDGPWLSLSPLFCRFPQIALGLWVRSGGELW